jgi:uncharacterized membrane protein
MKILGHPVHPMLVVYPIAMFTVALLLDIIYLFSRAAVLPTVSFYMYAAGILGGLIAAVFGFMDWLALPHNTRARRLGAWHGVGNLTMVVLQLISWFLRLGAPGHVPSTIAFVLSLLGVAIIFVTAWLGGELVYRLGSAVDQGANANAPSSLSGQPATATRDIRQPSR